MIMFTAVIALLIPVWLSAMDTDDFLPDNVVSTGAKNDGSYPDIVYVRGKGGRKVPEVYDKYFCSLADTADKNDTAHTQCVHHALFMQLCVQASNAKKLDMKPFQELVQKVKRGVVNHHVEIVSMTEKDMQHRLLSYIPCGTIHALINDKKVQLFFERKSKVIKQPMPTSLQFEFAFPENPSHGYSWKGHELVDTGELELKTIDYTFTSDQAHHTRIVETFNTLVGE